MRSGLRRVDAAAAWGLVLIGCIHNFIAAPANFDAVDTGLFWFLSAGLALWYAGAINLVRQATSARVAVAACVAANATLLAFILAFGAHTGSIASVGGVLLAVPAAVETGFSIMQLRRPPKR